MQPPHAVVLELAPHAGHPAVARACAYLERHPGRPICLDELARAAYASKYHLLRTFKKHLGVTPAEFHTRLRLGRARQLLEAGLPASRVAYETGFSDQSHLTRSFKRAFGVPPGRYVRAVARGAATATDTTPAPPIVQRRCAGLAGAGEAPSNALVRGQCSGAEAAEALAPLVAGAPRGATE